MLTTDIIYAIGIDFGHGETSFSYYNITWGKDISAQEATKNTAISLLDGKTKTIPSIYLYNRSIDKMYVGETAAINNGQIKGDHSNYVYGVSFKKPISRMSEDEKFLFKRYMMEIKKVLMLCSPVNLKDENLDENIKRNYVVVIAKPSGWLKDEDNLYLNLAEEAGLPVMGIWPESRASIMRFISKDDATASTNGEELSIDDINKIHNGCVLMDIGSSTTDFSYINKSMNFPIDDNGNDCGGQIIDEILLQYVLNLSCNAEIKKDISEFSYNSVYNSLLFAIRMAKESLFSGVEKPGLHVREEYESPTLAGEEFICRYKDCPLETVIRLLNEGLSAFNITPVGNRFSVEDNTYSNMVKDAVINGFTPALRNELRRFIADHVITDSNQSINCFILTGGTSKLFKTLGIDSYFKTAILSDIGLSDRYVHMDSDPSTSVSDGLALVGRNYALFKGCTNADLNILLNQYEKEKAKGLKNQLDIIVNEILRTFSAESVKEAIARDIRDEVMSKATKAIERFAGYHSDNPSLDDLKRNLTTAISAACSVSSEIINRHIINCLRSKLDEEKRAVEMLVRRYTVQEPNVPSTEKYGQMRNINLNIDIPELINSVSSKLTEEVVIGILYLMLFPIATVLWGAVRVIDFFSDEESITFEEFFENFINGADGPMNWVAQRGRLRAERERVEAKFKEKRSDISYEAFVKIKENLSGIDDIVNQGIKEAIESYKEDVYKVIARVFK